MTIKNVHALVNGFSRTHHHHPTGNHDTDVMPGTAHFHSLHQTFEPVAAVPIQPEPTMPNDWSSGNSDQPSSGAPNINKATPRIGTAVILLGVAVISRKVKNILGVLIMGVMIGYVAGAIMIPSWVVVMCPREPIDQSVNIFNCSAELRYCSIWIMAPAT